MSSNTAATDVVPTAAAPRICTECKAEAGEWPYPGAPVAAYRSLVAGEAPRQLCSKDCYDKWHDVKRPVVLSGHRLY